jgi:hypothetical protein
MSVAVLVSIEIARRKVSRPVHFAIATRARQNPSRFGDTAASGSDVSKLASPRCAVCFSRIRGRLGTPVALLN